MSTYLCIAPDVKLGENVELAQFINLCGCKVGDNTEIGAFVEIQKSATVARNCKISSHIFICKAVVIENDVFIDYAVTFINGTYPRATVAAGRIQEEGTCVRLPCVTVRENTQRPVTVTTGRMSLPGGASKELAPPSSSSSSRGPRGQRRNGGTA